MTLIIVITLFSGCTQNGPSPFIEIVTLYEGGEGDTVRVGYPLKNNNIEPELLTLEKISKDKDGNTIAIFTTKTENTNESIEVQEIIELRINEEIDIVTFQNLKQYKKVVRVLEINDRELSVDIKITPIISQ